MSETPLQTADPLAAPVTALPGIGRLRGEALKQAGITTLNDLLLNVPRRYLDRSRIPLIRDITRSPSQVRDGSIGEVTLIGTVERLNAVPGRKPHALISSPSSRPT